MRTGKHIASVKTLLAGSAEPALHRFASCGTSPRPARRMPVPAVPFVSSLFHLNNSCFYTIRE
ncbi:MAG: hypothetical protein K2M96_03900 [Prevotella sp.]|nr:hypothetical protein [Prevotella sp.]